MESAPFNFLIIEIGVTIKRKLIVKIIVDEIFPKNSDNPNQNQAKGLKTDGATKDKKVTAKGIKISFDFNTKNRLINKIKIRAKIASLF